MRKRGSLNCTISCATMILLLIWISFLYASNLNFHMMCYVILELIKLFSYIAIIRSVDSAFHNCVAFLLYILIEVNILRQNLLANRVFSQLSASHKHSIFAALKLIGF
jgi:hypothetical protein